MKFFFRLIYLSDGEIEGNDPVIIFLTQPSCIQLVKADGEIVTQQILSNKIKRLSIEVSPPVRKYLLRSSLKKA
jgi:hypothetical protein